MWSAVFDAMGDAVCVLDLDGTVHHCNRPMLTLLGLERDAVVGSKCFELVHGAHEFFEKCPYREALRTGRRESLELPLHDRWYEVTADPLRGEAGVIVGAVHVVRDITARVEAERERRDSDQRLALVYETISDVVFSIHVDADGRFSFGSVNQRFLDVTGLTEDQVVGRHVEEVISKPSLGLVLEHYRTAIRENRVVSWEERTRYPAGERIGHVSVAPLFAADGTCTRLIGAVHDLTDRVRAEEELRESEERLQLIHDNVGDSVLTFAVEAEGRFRVESVNRVFLEMTGRTRAAVEGKLVEQVIAEPLRSDVLRHCRAAVRRRRPERWEFVERHAAGAEVGDVALVPLLDADGECRRLLATVHEVTARVSTEDALRRQTAALQGLNALSIDLASLDREAELGKFLAQRLRRLTGAAAVAFSDYEPDDRVLATRAIDLAPGAMKTLTAAVIRRLEGTRSPVSDETYQEVVHNLNVTRATLTEASFGAIPAAVDTTVRRLLGVDRFIGLAYVVGGELYGTSVIALQSGAPAPPRELLDSFAGLAAVSLRRRRVERQLQAKTAELDRIFALSGDLLGLADVDGTFLRVNPAWETVLGYRPEELTGTRLTDLLHPDDRESTAAAMARLAKGVPVTGFHNRQRHRDGSYRIVEWRVTPQDGLISADGRDITDQVEARARREELEREAAEELRRASAYNRSLIEASLDPFMTIDPKGSITDVNEATVAATGRTRDELVGSDFADSFSDPTMAKAGLEQAFREGAVRDYSLAITHLDGRRTDVLFNASTYRDADGQVGGVFAAARDVGALMRAEDEIRHMNDELQRRVEERTRELTATNRDLQEFMYSLAHDLRTPLRAVDGFSFTVLEDYSDIIDPKGQDDLHRVRAAAQQMGILIDALLALSQLGHGRLDLRTVDLSEIARRVIDDLRAADPERSVEVTVEEGLTAASDEALIAIVLENLLGNAWKFTSGRPLAHIEFAAGDRDGLRVFFVRDDGAGFDPTYAGKLFAPFQRLHPSDAFPGTGTGLATVARILERLGGRWWADGEVGHGATFFFSLTGGEGPARADPE